MAFVPYVPPTRQKPISPQAQELANKIHGLIKEYRGYYPGLSNRDVRDALRTVSSGESEARTRSPALVASLVGGIAAALGAVVALRASAGADTPRVVAPAIIAVLVVVIGIALLVARNR